MSVLADRLRETAPRGVNLRGHGRNLRGGRDVAESTAPPCPVCGEPRRQREGRKTFHATCGRATCVSEAIARSKRGHRYNVVPLETRFWRRVAVHGPDDCWEWQAGRATWGYGRIGMPDSRRIEGAHRVSWMLNVGPIPEGMHVLHHCDNPPCVNPAHLFLGDPAANDADKRAKGRAVPPPVRRGHDNNTSKLTTEQVRDIRTRRAGGESTLVLSRSFGVAHSTVKRIVNRQTWGWLDA
jgi:hypothetical protein